MNHGYRFSEMTDHNEPWIQIFCDYDIIRRRLCISIIEDLAKPCPSFATNLCDLRYAGTSVVPAQNTTVS
jgi:hypothetical protein